MKILIVEDEPETGEYLRQGLSEAVALEAESRALLEFYEALADAQGVQLRLSGEASVVGNRLMLRRAISNLLSNALRHTAAGNTVEIEIGRSANQAILRYATREQ